jgi:hypothetical protein
MGSMSGGSSSTGSMSGGSSSSYHHDDSECDEYEYVCVRYCDSY